MIFRGDTVPALPLSYYEAPSAQALWDNLGQQCLAGRPGCDVLAIPHNSNWSNGRMFMVEYPGRGSEAQQAQARAAMEPLVEIFQHKGDSECINGVSGILGGPTSCATSRSCGCPPSTTAATGWGPTVCSGAAACPGATTCGAPCSRACASSCGSGPTRSSWASSPAPTPTTARRGLVDEDAYLGHVGREEGEPLGRLTGEVPAGPRNGPGGLVAVWATENSRDGIFEALRRRETYGTSGPRMAVRVFGGYGLPDDLCERGDLVATGDARGVPMGGQLPAYPGEGAPRMVVSALRDPQGLPLQRVQVIKGFIDADDLAQVVVYDVAGGDNGATVDSPDLRAPGRGGRCAVHRVDRSRVRSRPARVLLRAGGRKPPLPLERGRLPVAGGSGAAVCDELPAAIQERAWTSPIWYTPAGG